MSAAVKIAADIFCWVDARIRPRVDASIDPYTQKIWLISQENCIFRRGAFYMRPLPHKNHRPFCISRAAVAFYVGILTQISAAVIRAIL